MDRIGLFGSYFRKESNPESDIDLLISFDPEEEKFDNLMKIYDLLEDAFGNAKIDLVTENGLSPFLKP